MRYLDGWAARDRVCHQIASTNQHPTGTGASRAEREGEGERQRDRKRERGRERERERPKERKKERKKERMDLMENE